MSVPLSVKWISPFRELIIGGFQSLPLTLGGTFAFFAANSTNMIFLYLTIILALVIPFSVGITQWIVPGILNLLSKILGGEAAIWKSILLLLFSIALFFGGFGMTFSNDNNIQWSQIAVQYPGLLLFFAANNYAGLNKSPTEAPSKSVCHLVSTIASGKTSETIAPSYWLTSVSFLIMYLFRNALDNYNKPADSTATAQKVTRRKIQVIFAMIFILAVGLIMLYLRIFYTGCETMASTVSSLGLAILLFMPLYKLGSNSQLDFFGMFQNINLGCDSPKMACILKN